jgi:hypothetical protein
MRNALDFDLEFWLDNSDHLNHGLTHFRIAAASRFSRTIDIFDIGEKIIHFVFLAKVFIEFRDFECDKIAKLA